MLIYVELNSMSLIYFDRGEIVGGQTILTDVVHSGSKGGATGCGTNTNDQNSHWINSGSKITCNEEVCRNYKMYS